MIIVTGGAGFIGSCIVKELNNRGIVDIVIVDNLGRTEKWKNLRNLKYKTFIHKSVFLQELENLSNVELIIHMGACSSTTEQDADYLMNNNFMYSKKIYDWCTRRKCRLIYASSAAVYGNGEYGYDDSKTDEYMPLNMYGYTKKLFDQYVNASKSSTAQVQCVGLRFFNVFGPNEYHKATMASVVFHSYNQIKKDGKVKLFKSYRKDYKDGEQLRDFVYVRDVVSVVMFFFENAMLSGIYNVGTGKAETFKALAKAVFAALKKDDNIEYIDMPEGLAAKYQYYTEADLKRLRACGYKNKFMSLKDSVKEYVLSYLEKKYKNYY